MRARPALVTVLAATLVVTVDPGIAAACSCAPPNPRAAYRNADAAFVGRLTSVHSKGRGGVFRYRIERSYKRRLGRVVWVRSNLQSAACGLPDVIGRRYAIFLDRSDRKWTSSLCAALLTPSELRDAAEGRAGSSRSSCTTG